MELPLGGEESPLVMMHGDDAILGSSKESPGEQTGVRQGGEGDVREGE